MKIGNAIGVGVLLAVLGVGGYAAYVLVGRRGGAQLPGPYNPPVATPGPNAAPPQPQRTQQQDASAWIGVVDQGVGVANDLALDVKGWFE